MNTVAGFLNMFFGVVLSFRFTDLIDIIFISFIIYKIIQIVRETRAAQLFKGLFLFLIAAFLAKVLNLKTLSLVLNSLILFGPLVIVVLFQNEFRRILEYMGRAKMGNRFQNFLFSEKKADRLKLEKQIYVISKTCEDLSKKNVGAIIVFERKTKLADIVATGVMLNADISEELIKNLFFKNSPLHDGAVIVRENKIIAASCFLPKPSKEEYISRVLGSRHRAAIGMSENSDAVVVVVSEENGFVSVAENGKLKRNLSRTDLISYLQEGLISYFEGDNFKNFVERAKKNEKI